MFKVLSEKLSAMYKWVMKLVCGPVSERRFVISFVVAFGAVFLFWTLLVFVIDPYIYYHRAWVMKNVFSNSRARIPGVMRNFEYDTVLFGSSVCQNFRCSEIDAALNVRCVKATSAGLSSDTLSRYFETAWRYRGKKLTRCVVGIDFLGFAKKGDTSNYIYLYEDRIFPCEYFYSVDTASAILDVFATNISAPYNRISRHQLDADAMFSNKPRLKYGRKLLERDVRDLTTGPVKPDKQTKEKFDRHLLVHVRNHPEIRFDFFLPPYSIYYWCFLRECGKLDDYLELRDVFAEMAAQYPNVRIYDFQAEFDIVCSPDNYKDVTHYSPAINTLIINDIGKGRHVFPVEEFRRRTALIRSRSSEFQPAFDQLRRKKP